MLDAPRSLPLQSNENAGVLSSAFMAPQVLDDDSDSRISAETARKELRRNLATMLALATLDTEPE
jgi:hypothetical protein